VLGEVNGGWGVAMTTLMHERGTLGFALTARLEVQVKNLVALARETRTNGRLASEDPLFRDRIAQQWIELQELRFTNYRALTGLVKTGVPGPEGSIAKLHWSESNQRLTKLALEILGPRAQMEGPEGPWNGYWQYQQLRSRGNTIEAGTSEVLRNIISERVLGLPRSR
jgi:alkylation response protein AidB-like acyl-CoA dehydrogenase